MSSVYSIETAQPCWSAYRSCASICWSVKSGRNEKVPCVTLMVSFLSSRSQAEAWHLSDSSIADRRHELHVGHVGGLEVERDVLPDLQGSIELGAALGGLLEDVGPFLEVVLALVASLDHRLDGDAVGRRAGGDTHRVADRAAAELEHDVLAEVVQELVHLACVDAA